MGCAACGASRPVIPSDPGSQSVLVVRSRAALPSDCRSLGALSATDGQLEGRGRYEGTEERAVRCLRTLSAQRGGNRLFLPPQGDPEYREAPLFEIVTDCADCGLEVVVLGVAYACPSER